MPLRLASASTFQPRTGEEELEVRLRGSRCGVLLLLLLLLRGNWVAVGSGYPAWRLWHDGQPVLV